MGRLLRMHANKREDIEEIAAGDIAAVVGLKLTTTGDTLCDPDRPIVLESMTFPEPVIAVAIEPKTKADEEKLGLSLSRLALEDPTFRVTTETETSQTLIHGMGELHLEIIVDRLLREFRVEANVGKPQVAYRETIRRRLRPRAGSCARREVAASTVTSTWKSSPLRARASSSRTRSWGAPFPASTSRPSRRASARPWRPESWPAIQWSTSRCG